MLIRIQNYIKRGKIKQSKGRRNRFKSLIIEKDFEPENPKQLEELDDNSCKWPIGHPDENPFICGRTSLKDFSIANSICCMRISQKAKKKMPTIKKIFKSTSKRKYKLARKIYSFSLFLKSYFSVENCPPSRHI